MDSGTIMQNDWKQKVSNDAVTIGEINSRMFNRQTTCCARLYFKSYKHSKQENIANTAEIIYKNNLMLLQTTKIETTKFK